MTLEELRAVAEIVEKLTNRYRDQEAAHKAALTEIRASFNARTSADEKIIEWLRIKVQDARAERDALRAEVAALKSQTPKQSHPVAVGGYLRRLTGFNTTPAGEIARVTLVDDDDASHLEYEVVRPNGEKGRWSAKGCEPCDQPATHDTDAGKAAAESSVRTEPVPEEIKVGDIIEVVSATPATLRIYTEPEDVGRRGVVTAIDGMRISVGEVPGYKLPISGIVGKCDVRKVTT